MKTQNNKKPELILVTVLMLMMTFNWPTAGEAQPVEEWIRRYNNFDKEDKAKAMKLDAEGNIYVTGYSETKEGNKDFLTVKYSSKGDQLWAAYYDGPGNISGKDDEANALALDRKGNVYVTGYSHAGVRGKDYCTIKYNSKGDQIWVSFFSGVGRIEDSEDEAIGIVFTEAGFIQVTGNSDGNLTGMDFCTIQYNTNGEQVWAQSVDGYASGEDQVRAIISDNDDNIIVTGYSEGIVTRKDYMTIKYDMYGEEMWRSYYNGLGGNIVINEDEPAAMTVDVSGNIYVTGSSYGPGADKDFLTIKYDAEGQEVWVSRFNNDQSMSGLQSDDEPKAIAIDASENIYVTGRTRSSGGGSDYLTVKINEKGNTEWFKIYNSEIFENTEDGANALATDRRGNIYVTGYINGIDEHTDCGNERGIDFCTIKYNSSGRQLWVKGFNGTGRIGNNDDIARAIEVSQSGKIIVMGESTGDETDLDYCLVVYSEFLPYEESALNTKAYYVLNDNFPNPFNPVTKISFSISVASRVSLEIFDISGRQVAMIVNENLQSGEHQYYWDAALFSSGTYFYTIRADGFVQTKKMLLIK